MKNSFIFLALIVIGIHSPAQKKVYLCTDPKSQYYHYDELCKELEKCKFEVKEEKENEAQDQEKRICKVCKDFKPKKDSKKE